MTTAARHDATGRLVGYTEVVVPLGAPESSWQHDTLVMREHRGHGLGLAMKVANLWAGGWSGTPACAPSAPGTRRRTHPMIAVNEEMGFASRGARRLLAQGHHGLSRLRETFGRPAHLVG